MNANPDVDFFHYGVAVKDLGVAVDFFQNSLGLEVVADRVIDAPYINDLVGKKDVSAKVVMLKFPSGGYLELLSWSKKIEFKFKFAKIVGITTVGAQHLCVYVANLEKLLPTLNLHPRVKILSRFPVTVTHGPNKGARVLFVTFDKILHIELFEKPNLN